MVRSPRATLAHAVVHPRSVDLAVLIVVISAVCSSGFLMTRVGRLAALDQQVRQLESVGVVMTDDTYETLRAMVPYRPVVSAAFILVGWPILWVGAARILVAVCDRVLGLPREGGRAGSTARRRAQALAMVVHASAIFAVRAMVAAPINYARESLGGATSLSLILPAFGESTFPARLFGAVDVFVVWWVVLVALGVSILYQTRTLPVARWLFGAYAGGAAALALTQALRGGV